MTTKLTRFGMLLGGVFLLNSCFSYRDIEVKDFSIDDYSMQGFTILLNFSATVLNPNRAFAIQEAGGDINQGSQPFATAQLVEAIRIVGKSEQRYSGQLQLTIKDLMSIFRMGTNADSWELNSFFFTGDLCIKASGIKKTFKYKDIPLNQLLNNL